MSAEVDEIVPVSKGGSPYDRGNVQLVHRICNQRKSDKIIRSGERQKAVNRPLPTLRSW